MHYNIYPSAEISGSTLPGVSSGQAIEVMQTLADQTLAEPVWLRVDGTFFAGNSRR